MQSLIVPSPHLTMHNLEEDLTCSVCYSLFTDPRVLPCSHTFCKSCLDKVFQVSAIYSIWRPLRLPLKGCYALPINPSLRAIIKKFPRPPSCPEHHRQPLNVYCVQDRQLICGFCLTVGQHQGHSIDDMQAAFIRERQAPAHLLARLSDHRRAEVCELGEQLEQEKASCEVGPAGCGTVLPWTGAGACKEERGFYGGPGHRKRGGVSGLRSTHPEAGAAGAAGPVVSGLGRGG